MRFGAVDSLTIVFPAARQVEVTTERLHPWRRRAPLLEARCSLVSTGTERRCFEGDFVAGTHWEQWVRYPFRPGYSFVGATVDGRRICANIPHAQYALVGESEAFPVPDGISDEDASWFALAAIAQHGIARSGLEPGDAVVVVGAGVLGQLVAQIARAAGAGSVIVVAGAGPRLDAAVAHGASHGVPGSAADVVDAVRERTDGEGAAIVFDVTGSETAFPDALKLARREGTLVLLGDVGDPGGQRLGPELLDADLRIVGAYIGNADAAARRRLAENFFALLGRGAVVVADLVTTRASPRDAAGVYSSLAGEDRARLGVLFDWTDL